MKAIPKLSQPIIVFVAGIVALSLFRVWFNAFVPLSGEEAYYWMWSQKPALSYFDHPPMIAWVIRLGATVLGDTPLGVRIGGIILHALTAVLVAWSAFRVFGCSNAAAWAGGLFATSAFFVLTSSVMIPDAPLLFFWALTLLLVMEAMRPGRERLWMLAGLAVGSSFLSKFHAILLVGAIGLSLALSSRRRHHVRSVWLYLGAFLGAVAVLPILIWNAQHEWASFGFQLGSRHKFIFPSLTYFGEMLAAPFGLIGLVTYPLCVAGAIWGLRYGLCNKRDDLVFLSLACLIPGGFFLALSLVIRIDSQWAMVSYVSGVILAAGFGTEIALSGDRWRKWILPACLANGILVMVVAYCALLVLLSRPDIIPSDFNPLPYRSKFASRRLNKIFGWEELGQRVQQDVDKLGGRGKVFVISKSGYGTAAGIAFYTPSHPDVFMFGDALRDGRQFAFWEENAEVLGKNAVVLASKPTKRRLEEHFRSVRRANNFYAIAGGAVRRVYRIYHCEDLQTPLTVRSKATFITAVPVDTP